MNYTDVINRYTRYDTKLIVDSPYIKWDGFKNSTILITGATGFIGTQLVLSIAKASMDFNLNTKLILLVRNKQKAKQLFLHEILFNKIKIIEQDINKKLKYNSQVDYIIHTASNTDSNSFVKTPVETINTIITGTRNILEFAKNKNVKSLVYLSSMEVYGIVNSDTPLEETDYRCLDLLNERNSYPQAKRLAENLCYSYFKEYNVPVKIARLSQIIGANIPYDDSRVFVQFAKRAVEGKDIILHTDGLTVRNYCYITDCITGILTILQNGMSGESYNVTNKSIALSIKEMAEKISEYGENIKIKYDLKIDNKYLPKIKLLLNTDKLEKLNWQPEINTDKIFSKLINGLLYQKYQNLILNQNRYLKIKNIIKKFINIRTSYNHKFIVIGPIKIKINREKLFNLIYKPLKIKKNRILFCNYQGHGYGCNPKYIAEEILKQNLNVELLWLIKDSQYKQNLPPNIKVVNYKTEAAIYAHATSAIWIDNYHKNYFIKKGLRKKENQTYIQTWHGSLGIKKIDKDVKFLTQNTPWVEISKINAKYTDYWLSNSSWESQIFQNGFWNVKNILEIGHPRNDIFFKNNNNLEEQIKQKYDIPRNKKLILYAPTFREDLSIHVYNINYKLITEAFNNKFNEEFVWLVRLHPRMQDIADILNLNGVINVSNYSDIQELLAIADIAITDYSSCIFDFLFTQKAAFIYAADIEEYNNERGFYYPLEQTPFPIARNNNEFIQNIQKFNLSDYKNKVEKFLKEKGTIDDGNASQKVVDLIKKYL